MLGSRRFQFTTDVVLQHAALEIKAFWRSFQTERCVYTLARGQATDGIAA